MAVEVVCYYTATKSFQFLAAYEAPSLGYGGISMVRRARGHSRKTIDKVMRQIAEGTTPPGRIRRMGAGRRKITVNAPEFLASLECLIEPETRGDPKSPLRWICKSTRTLAIELTWQKHPVSHEKVAQLLRAQNYSLQSSRSWSTGTIFLLPRFPRAFPYGIYDLARNTGYVNVGTDHDTGAFAVASIRG